MPFIPKLQDLDDVDYVIINGIRSPGVATVLNLQKPRKYEVRAGFAQDGATAVYIGNEPATWDVEIGIWKFGDPVLEAMDPTAAISQLTKWKAFALALDLPPKGVAGKALSFLHPVTLAPPFNIKSALCTNITGFEQKEPGFWTCTISFMEFRPPTPALGKASSDNINIAETDAERAGNKIIEGLVNEVKALGGFAS